MKTLPVLLVILLFCAACSMPPERPFTKNELNKTGVYTYFTVSDSPESVLAALNKDGEVVLDAMYRKRPVWIKILGKSQGLTITIIEK